MFNLHLPNILGNMLGDCPSYAESVVGGGAPAQLVNEDEAAGRGVLEDTGGLQHLRQEGGDALHLAVRCSDTHHHRICIKIIFIDKKKLFSGDFHNVKISDLSTNTKNN